SNLRTFGGNGTSWSTEVLFLEKSNGDLPNYRLYADAREVNYSQALIAPNKGVVIQTAIHAIIATLFIKTTINTGCLYTAPINYNNMLPAARDFYVENSTEGSVDIYNTGKGYGIFILQAGVNITPLFSGDGSAGLIRSVTFFNLLKP